MLGAGGLAVLATGGLALLGAGRCMIARGTAGAAVDAARITPIGVRRVVMLRATGRAAVGAAGVAALDAGPVVADLETPTACARTIGIDRDVVGVPRPLEAAARDLAAELVTVAIVGGPDEASAALNIDAAVRRIGTGASTLDRFAHVLYLGPPRGGFALRHPLRPLSVAYGVS